MSRNPTHVTREFDPRVTVEYYSVACGEIQCRTSAGFTTRDEIDAPDLGVSITVRESPEYNRLDRQKLADLGVDPEIIAAASRKVPSKLHFQIGGINAGITQNGVPNGVPEPTPEEE